MLDIVEGKQLAYDIAGQHAGCVLAADDTVPTAKEHASCMLTLADATPHVFFVRLRKKIF